MRVFFRLSEGFFKSRQIKPLKKETGVSCQTEQPNNDFSYESMSASRQPLCHILTVQLSIIIIVRLCKKIESPQSQICFTNKTMRPFSIKYCRSQTLVQLTIVELVTRVYRLRSFVSFLYIFAIHYLRFAYQCQFRRVWSLWGMTTKSGRSGCCWKRREINETRQSIASESRLNLTLSVWKSRIKCANCLLLSTSLLYHFIVHSCTLMTLQLLP